MSRLLLAATMTLLVLGAPVQAQDCGDCNGDTLINILDALIAAQSAASIITLSSPQFELCNVNGTPGGPPAGDVSILDALTIAQYSALVLPSVTCSSPPSCTASTPSPAVPAHDVLVSYEAIDLFSLPVDLLVEFSSDGGGTYQPATQGAGGDPTSGLATSPAPGTPHTYSWDTSADAVGTGGAAQTVQLRLTVSHSGGSSTCATGAFDVDNTVVNPVWTQLLPPSSPSGRYYPAGAWDSTRSRMLSFGGTSVPRELWMYDPVANTWTQGATAPGGSLTHHTLVYDPTHDCAFSWNGDAGELWRCDFAGSPGGTWVQATPGGGWPDGHWGTGVYDTANDRIVWAGSQNVGNALYALPIGPGGAPGTWSILTPTGGSYGARWGWRGDYDPTAQRMVVFSGNPNVGSDRIVIIDIPAGGPYTVTILNPPANPHSFWYTPTWMDGPMGYLYIWSGTYSGSTIDYATRVDLAAASPLYEPVTQGQLNPPNRYGCALANDRQARIIYIFGGKESAGGPVRADTWQLIY